jgi:mRNA-degrading endonuclease RelE of RelBE toxin-antitoxin system
MSLKRAFVYQPEMTKLFQKNLRRYASLREQIRRHVDEILADPYLNSERLGKMPGGLDLRGCRNVRIAQGFRIIFVVCEGCRRVPECRYCFCESWSDKTVVFLTVGPHERAYAIRGPSAGYAANQNQRDA